jgi:hypothetical protein
MVLLNTHPLQPEEAAWLGKQLVDAAHFVRERQEAARKQREPEPLPTLAGLDPPPVAGPGAQVLAAPTPASDDAEERLLNRLLARLEARGVDTQPLAAPAGTT